MMALLKTGEPAFSQRAQDAPPASVVSCFDLQALSTADYPMTLRVLSYDPASHYATANVLASQCSL